VVLHHRRQIIIIITTTTTTTTAARTSDFIDVIWKWLSSFLKRASLHEINYLGNDMTKFNVIKFVTAGPVSD
jgi:hypothetical protein